MLLTLSCNDAAMGFQCHCNAAAVPTPSLFPSSLLSHHLHISIHVLHCPHPGRHLVQGIEHVASTCVLLISLLGVLQVFGEAVGHREPYEPKEAAHGHESKSTTAAQHHSGTTHNAVAVQHITQLGDNRYHISYTTRAVGGGTMHKYFAPLCSNNANTGCSPDWVT